MNAEPTLSADALEYLKQVSRAADALVCAIGSNARISAAARAEAIAGVRASEKLIRNAIWQPQETV